LIAISCPTCGAQVSDPARFAAGEQAHCAYCRQSFLVDHTAGSRVAIVVPHHAFIAPAQQRVRQLGFRPGMVWTRDTFNGWSPQSKREAMMVGVCVQFGPPFAANYWNDLLSRSWPELVDHIGPQPRGQLNALSSMGHTVVVVYGQTDYDLRSAIAEAKLDAAVSSAHAFADEPPASVSLVVPDARFTPVFHERVAQLGSRLAHVIGREFQGWHPSDGRELLLIGVAAQAGPPFSAMLWHDYLGRSWPELIDTIGRRQRGQLEAKSPSGHRVIVVFGQTEHDLYQAAQQLTW
jgi:hypothetical protein